MLNFKMRDARKDETPYFYRLSVVCFGKTLELGVSYDDLSKLKSRGRTVLAQADNIKSRFSNLNGRSLSKKGRNSKARTTNKNAGTHLKQDQE